MGQTCSIVLQASLENTIQKSGRPIWENTMTPASDILLARSLPTTCSSLIPPLVQTDTHRTNQRHIHARRHRDHIRPAYELAINSHNRENGTTHCPPPNNSLALKNFRSMTATVPPVFSSLISALLSSQSPFIANLPSLIPPSWPL